MFLQRSGRVLRYRTPHPTPETSEKQGLALICLQQKTFFLQLRSNKCFLKTSIIIGSGESGAIKFQSYVYVNGGLNHVNLVLNCVESFELC